MFNEEEKEYLSNLSDIALVTLTTIMPIGFVYSGYKAFTGRAINKNIDIISMYLLMFFFTFYLSASIQFKDLQLFFIAFSILTISLFFLFHSNDEKLLKNLTIGYLVLVISIEFDFLYNLIFSGTIIRPAGLTHNAFNAAIVIILFTIILVYHNKSNKPLLVISGFVLAHTLTRTGLMILLFTRTKFLPILIGILFGLILIYLINPEIIKSRLRISQAIELRQNLNNQSEPQLTKGTGLGQFNKIYPQNPHNSVISIQNQLGIIQGYIFLVILYLGLLYYGFKYGLWKILPLIILDFLDAQWLNLYALTSTYLIYLFMMSKPKIQKERV